MISLFINGNFNNYNIIAIQKLWRNKEKEREELQKAHLSHKVLLTNYSVKAAIFMRQTGLLGQYKTLDEDQNDWIAGADVNQNDTSTKKGRGRRTSYATGPQGSKTMIETAARSDWPSCS